jgi:hypothetical protein
MSENEFRIEDYDVLYNAVSPAMIFSFNTLLQNSVPRIGKCTDQNVRKLMAQGAHIITVIHSGTNIIAGLGIFLPISHETGHYHEKRIATVHEGQKCFSAHILNVIDVVAEDVLKKTKWERVSYTSSEQWDYLFHICEEA